MVLQPSVVIVCSVLVCLPDVCIGLHTTCGIFNILCSGVYNTVMLYILPCVPVVCCSHVYYSGSGQCSERGPPRTLPDRSAPHRLADTVRQRHDPKKQHPHELGALSPGLLDQRSLLVPHRLPQRHCRLRKGVKADLRYVRLYLYMHNSGLAGHLKIRYKTLL